MLKLMRKALPLGMLLVGWFGRASHDGKITLVELVELMQAIIVELDLTLSIEIPPELGPAFGLQAPAASAAPAVTPAGEGR